MIAPFGQVISTRILRDNHGVSRGVGFARMESKEKCEDIIREFSGKFLPGKCRCFSYFRFSFLQPVIGP